MVWGSLSGSYSSHSTLFLRSGHPGANRSGSFLLTVTEYFLVCLPQYWLPWFSREGALWHSVSITRMQWTALCALLVALCCLWALSALLQSLGLLSSVVSANLIPGSLARLFSSGCIIHTFSTCEWEFLLYHPFYQDTILSFSEFCQSNGDNGYFMATLTSMSLTIGKFEHTSICLSVIFFPFLWVNMFCPFHDWIL